MPTADEWRALVVEILWDYHGHGLLKYNGDKENGWAEQPIEKCKDVNCIEGLRMLEASKEDK
jgi:hypothetical protein